MSLDIYLYHHPDDEESIWSANITHNLGKMADAAGIYEHIWGRSGITRAGDLAEKVQQGVARMVANPAVYEKYNSSNGWGTYERFVPWLLELAQACREYPDAFVCYSR